MKALIVSHNSFSTYQSMGKTFCTLFSAFKKENLCQLYVYPTVPDIDCCSSFYRITDKDVLLFFKRLKVYGKEIRPEDVDESVHNLYENPKDESFYRNKRNKSSFRILARDFLWTITPWFNSSLKKWLRKNDITHVFVAPGEYKFIYDVAIKCANFLKVPIITYVCDEFFFVEKKTRLLDKVKDCLLRKKMIRLMNKSSAIITISEEMKCLYEPFFKKPTNVIMTGSSFPISSAPLKRAEIRDLTYMGNLSCNRYVSICEIGDALDEINQTREENFTLNVYTKENNSAILEELSKRKSIKMKGFVTGDEFSRVFHSAQCLLHVEAFDEISIDRVKNSISTKIADCLGAGIPLLAYGPSNIASMKHLIRNKSSFVINEKEELVEKLLFFLSMSENDKSAIVENALRTAQKYHFSELNGKKLYNLIDSIK